MPMVEIRRNADGVIRAYRDPYEWQGDYIWADGNYSCDCNRYLFFQRAIEPPEQEGDCECGNGSFSVRIIADDGSTLYADDDWGDSPAYIKKVGDDEPA